MPTQPTSNTERPNGALGISHLCVLAPFSIFSEVATELTSIVGQSPIKADRDREEDADEEGRLVARLARPRPSYAAHSDPAAGAARTGCRGRGGIDVRAGSWCGAIRSLGAR